MCGNQEWESLSRRFRGAVGDSQLRELVADAAARIESFVEELKARRCTPDETDPGCGRRGRSRGQWV
jgi:hypothetical protein